MTLRGIIFDFDGVILDTEVPEYQSWQEIYESYGCSLPVSAWVVLIGAGWASGVFDPYGYLEEQVGRPIDRETIRARRRQRNTELISIQPVLPGVQGYISEAKRLGLALGVASSSPHDWVDGHLNRLGLRQHFDCIKCAEDVARTKPDPALYLAALDALGLRPDEAVALEDSPNGVLAARRAGLFCIIVPNAMTRELAFEHTDLMLDSLADLPLEELISKFEQQRVGDHRGERKFC